MSGVHSGKCPSPSEKELKGRTLGDVKNMVMAPP